MRVLALLLLTSVASAQTGGLAGRVTDAETAIPLPGATVQVGERGAVTDADGSFRLDGLSAGTTTVTVRSAGYTPAEIRVELVAGATTQLDVALRSVQLATVVVQARQVEATTKARTPRLLTPQAVAVVPRAVLRAQDARSTGDALANVSAASAVRRNGPDARVTLRGFEAEPTGGGVRRNGVEFASLVDRLGANVERMEVLKGPASILYGRLEPGGVVNLVTAQPLASRELSTSIRTGVPGQARATLDASAPLRPRVDGRLIADISHEGSSRNHVWTRDALLAPSAAWQASPRTRVTVEGEARALGAVLDPGMAAPGSLPSASEAVPLARFFGEPDARLAYGALGLFGTAETDLGAERRLQVSLSAARYARRRDLVRLDSLIGGGTEVARGLQVDRVALTYLAGEALVSARARTGPVVHDLIAGLETTRIAAAVSLDGPLVSRDGQLLAGPIEPVPLTAPEPTGLPADLVEFLSADVRALDAGLFVQNRATLGLGGDRALHLVGAVRFARVVAQADWLAIARTPEVPEGTSSRRVPLTAITPAAGVVAEIAPGLALYASAGQSFNPVIEQVAEDGSPFEPTRGVQAEAGAKADLFGGRLAASIAAFVIEKRNAVSESPGGFFVQTGRQRSRGVELDLLAEPRDGLTLLASYALLNAEVVEDAVIPVGTPLPFAPRHSGRFWGEWASGRWAARAGLSASGERTSDLTDRLVLEPVMRLDGGVAVEAGRWTLRLDARAPLGRAVAAAEVHAGANPLVVVWPEPTGEVRLGATVGL